MEDRRVLPNRIGEIRAIEALIESNAPFRLRSVPFTPAPCRVRWSETVLPGLFVVRVQSLQAMEVETTLPEGVRGLVIPLNRPQPMFRVGGRVIRPGMVATAKPTVTLRTTLPATGETFMVYASEPGADELAALIDQAAPTVKLSTRAKSDLLAALDVFAPPYGTWAGGPDPDPDRAFEGLLAQLVKVMSADSEREAVPQVRYYDVFMRASRLMEREWASLTTVELMADKLDVSPRVLYYAFESALQLSPHRFLRCVQLSAVRRELLDLEQDDKPIHEVFADNGVRHPGRGAAEYRELYGEAPSETRQAGWT